MYVSIKVNVRRQLHYGRSVLLCQMQNEERDEGSTEGYDEER